MVLRRRHDYEWSILMWTGEPVIQISIVGRYYVIWQTSPTHVYKAIGAFAKLAKEKSAHGSITVDQLLLDQLRSIQRLKNMPLSTRNKFVFCNPDRLATSTCKIHNTCAIDCTPSSRDADTSKLILLERQMAQTGVFAAYGMNRLCYPSHPELDGLLCYKRCKSGYNGVGPVCWANCPPRTTDIGALCTKHSQGRGVGKPLHTCKRGQEKNGLLCYPKCKSGYGGAGPVCWQRCRSGYKDDGMSCRKDVSVKNRDVGNCPWHDKCGLCGGPWYNVCGKRRNCGGKCPSGYRNDGCTCWRDAHIYFKKSYGRGVGSPMVCGSNEDQNLALCYKKCPSHFKGVGPVCWATCSGKTTDTGTQCQKKSYGRGVGKVINCLKTPSCSDISDCVGLKSVFENIKGIQRFQTGTCQNLYARLKPWLHIIRSFNSCYKNKEWGTISMSYSVGAAVGVTGSGNIGIAVDVDANKGICFVGYCTGFKTDISVGADVEIGWWDGVNSLAGKSKVLSVGADVPFTEFGANVGFVKAIPSGKYIGTTFSIGGGIGLSPIDVAGLTCNTPADKIVQFTP